MPTIGRIHQIGKSQWTGLVSTPLVISGLTITARRSAITRYHVDIGDILVVSSVTSRLTPDPTQWARFLLLSRFDRKNPIKGIISASSAADGQSSWDLNVEIANITRLDHWLREATERAS
jgi:hypothetical protein